MRLDSGARAATIGELPSPRLRVWTVGGRGVGAPGTARRPSSAPAVRRGGKRDCTRGASRPVPVSAGPHAKGRPRSRPCSCQARRASFIPITSARASLTLPPPCTSRSSLRACTVPRPRRTPPRRAAPPACPTPRSEVNSTSACGSRSASSAARPRLPGRHPLRRSGASVSPARPTARAKAAPARGGGGRSPRPAPCRGCPSAKRSARPPPPPRPLSTRLGSATGYRRTSTVNSLRAHAGHGRSTAACASSFSRCQHSSPCACQVIAASSSRERA